MKRNSMIRFKEGMLQEHFEQGHHGDSRINGNLELGLSLCPELVLHCRFHLIWKGPHI